MKCFAKRNAAELIITTFFFLASWLLLPFVLDDMGAFFEDLAASQYSDSSFLHLHYMAMLGIKVIYQSLYNAMPSINWLGIAVLFFEFAGLFLSLVVIRTVIFKNIGYRWTVIVLQLLFAFFFAENIFCVSHTRFSLLYCGLSLFALLFSKSLSKKQTLLYSFVFLIGLLHRPESSLGMLVVVSACYLVWHFDMKHLITRAAFPLLATMVLFGYFAIDNRTTTVFVRQIEPEIEYKIREHYMVNLSEMKTAVDSVKYEAAACGVWFDTETMSAAFLRTLLLPWPDLSHEHVTKIFMHVLSFYEYYLFVPVCFLISLLLSMYLKGAGKLWLKILLLHAALFGILFVSDFNGELIDKRHFCNIHFIGLLVMAFYFFSKPATLLFLNANRKVFIGLTVPVMLAIVITLRAQVISNQTTGQLNDCFEKTMEAIEQKHQHQTIVITIRAGLFFNHNFSFTNHIYRQNKYLLFDFFTYSSIPEYVDYLSRTCQCNAADPVIFYQWLSAQNALYMADAPRYELTERYMRIVHGQPLKFVVTDSLKKVDCIDNTRFKDFQLRKVSLTDGEENIMGK